MIIMIRNPMEVKTTWWCTTKACRKTFTWNICATKTWTWVQLQEEFCYILPFVFRPFGSKLSIRIGREKPRPSGRKSRRLVKFSLTKYYVLLLHNKLCFPFQSETSPSTPEATSKATSKIASYVSETMLMKVLKIFFFFLVKNSYTNLIIQGDFGVKNASDVQKVTALAAKIGMEAKFFNMNDKWTTLFVPLLFFPNNCSQNFGFHEAELDESLGSSFRGRKGQRFPETQDQEVEVKLN